MLGFLCELELIVQSPVTRTIGRAKPMAVSPWIRARSISTHCCGRRSNPQFVVAT